MIYKKKYDNSLNNKHTPQQAVVDKTKSLLKISYVFVLFLSFFISW